MTNAEKIAAVHAYVNSIRMGGGPEEPNAGPWVKCLKCGDVIRSEYRHDSRWCKCKTIFVDGGGSYTRLGWPGGDQNEYIKILGSDDLEHDAKHDDEGSLGVCERLEQEHGDQSRLPGD